MALDVANLGFKVDSSPLVKAKTDLNAFADAATRTVAPVTAVGQAVGKTSQAAAASAGGMSRFANEARNVSYQIQDMAVQLSMGTSVMRTMGQQLPQLLGGFGLWGAAIGAVVAVGAGLAPMLLGVEGEAEELKDILRDLANAQANYSDAVDLSLTSLADLTAEFGRNALAARDLYSAMKDIALLEYAQQVTKSTQAIKGEIEGINRLVSMHQAATNALGYSAKTAFALNAQAVKELREEYGLTLPQAQGLTDALKDIDRASTALEQANGMKAFADAVADAVRHGAEVPPHILEAARQAADLAAQGYRVANAAEQANNNTGAAITTTNNWAVAMSGVAAQINAIASALSSIGGGMLSRASMYVERNALAAGKTVAQARVEVEKFKASTEWDAQIMGARGKGGIFGAIQEKALEAAKAIDLSNIEMAAENAILVQNAQKTERAAAAKAKKAGGSKKEAKETRDLIGELNKELDARQALIGLYGEERARVEALQQVQQKLGDDIGKYSKKAIQGAADRIVAVEKEEEAWEGVMQRMESLTDGLASAWGDWLSGGLRDFKGFVSNILGSFKSMVSDMIAAAVRAPIGRALGAAMGMGGATSAFAGDPLSAALNTAMGGGGILSKIGTSIGTAISGAMSGFGSVFSGLFSGGLGGAAGALTTALGGATSGLAGLATAAGAIAAPLAAVAAVFSFFKSKTTELDRGLRVTVDGMDALVETFRKTETRRFWGLSKKRRTSYEEADAEIADPIESAIGKVQQSVLDMAASIGTGSAAFETFAYQFKLSTKDMTDEEALAAIQEEMGKFGDAFAAMIPDIADFAKEGEGIGATLERLSAALGTVNGVLGDLGLQLYRVSVRGADAASQFAELFGGLDQFAQASSAYYEAFYSDAERFARLQEVSNKAIRDAGLAVPATREAYRRLVEAQDLTTEAGRKAAAVLLQLAPAFDQIYDAAEATRAAAAQAIADANASRTSLLDSLLTDQQRAAQAQAEIAATFAALNLTVPTTLDGLRAIIAGLDLTGEAGRDALARIAGIADALRDRLTPVQQAVERATSGGSSGRDSATSEREQLERQLLQLQGNTAELLRRERLDVAPANRALWDMVQAAKAAADVMDKFSADTFATRADFELAQARAANSILAPAATPAAEARAREERARRDSAALIEVRDNMRSMVNETRRLVRETREMRMLQEGTA